MAEIKISNNQEQSISLMADWGEIKSLITVFRKNRDVQTREIKETFFIFFEDKESEVAIELPLCNESIEIIRDLS